jgi:hypothetical protein
MEHDEEVGCDDEMVCSSEYPETFIIQKII